MNLVTRDYQGYAITIQDDGWFNATQAAAQMGRRVDVWLKTNETQEYIKALCEITNTTERGYLKTKRGASGGTWLHPKLAVRFAQWLDPRFAVWCDAQIDQLVRGKHDWFGSRHSIASSTKVQSAMIQEVRKAIGKATEPHHFMNEHKLINSLLTGEYKGIDRDKLSKYELDFLAHFEVRNAILIGMGLSYEQRKDALKAEALNWRMAHTAITSEA